MNMHMFTNHQELKTKLTSAIDKNKQRHFPDPAAPTSWDDIARKLYDALNAQIVDAPGVRVRTTCTNGAFEVHEISRFLGIIIAMYYNDHAPPHFHARYGESEIRVEIETSAILGGNFPRRARKLVLEWTELHREELLEDWRLAEERKPLRKIEPLE